ncbi:MAG: hydrogenase subunit MbhD domain-containing protein [Acidaminobacteraceae bacterium]
MVIFNIIVLVIMILGSIAAARTKDLVGSVIIFMMYSLMMAILWQQMNAPDLAITEAAVGAGITSILFIITLRKIKVIKK